MARRKQYRRHYRRQKFKLKLKKTTIYSIFSFGLLIAGVISLLAFSKSQPSFIFITTLLEKYFGSISILFPLTLILLGFFFLRLKFFLLPKCFHWFSSSFSIFG